MLNLAKPNIWNSCLFIGFNQAAPDFVERRLQPKLGSSFCRDIRVTDYINLIQNIEHNHKFSKHCCLMSFILFLTLFMFLINLPSHLNQFILPLALRQADAFLIQCWSDPPCQCRNAISNLHNLSNSTASVKSPAQDFKAEQSVLASPAASSSGSPPKAARGGEEVPNGSDGSHASMIFFKLSASATPLKSASKWSGISSPEQVLKKDGA